jgi:hypothetical protein
MTRVRLILLTLVALSLFMVSDATARIISYAPVSTRYAKPAVQPRDASHYLLLESPDMPFWGSPIMGPVMPSYQPRGQLVLHHATGEQEPRVVLSRDGQYDMIGLFAMNETPDGVRHYLVMTNPESTSGTTAPLPPATPPPPPPGTIVYPPGTPPLTTSPYPLPRYLYSNDDGATWKVLDLPDVLGTQDFLRQDIGGTVTRGRGSQIRLGTSETPFIFGAAARNQAGASTVFYAVDKGGAVRPLIEMAADFSALLIGSNRTGSQLLIAGAPIVNSVAQPTGIRILDLDGTLEDVLPLSSTHPQMEGWITSSGAVYLEETGPNLATQRVSYIDGGVGTILTGGPRGWTSGEVIFAVPTHDFDGAWMVQRNSGAPTRLLRHLPGSGVEEMWKDITGAEVEAVHVGSSGERLLIQVHRPRAADGRVILDPALAIWNIGSGMPRRYDELFLAEGPAKGFVSLDVDAAALGAPFVFDSAPLTNSGGGPIVSPAPPGGGDVTQEWGVVRASLQQKLVLPALARLSGAFDSFWKSDVTVWNPDVEAMTLKLRFAPSDGTPHLERELTVAAGELSYVPDALHTWFGLESGGGALFIEPPLGEAIGITSRLYNETSEGSYGMGVSPIDIFAASSARYYLTFAGALQGASTRTNLLVTDAGGHGSSFGVKASGPTGFTGRTDVAFEVPAGGQIQINDLATVLNVSGQAAARFETLGGFTIPSLVSIDNRTNDPTMFPPDIVSGVMRVIPMIGHLDGANDSRFRTDLYLYNPSDKLKSVNFLAKSLDADEPETHVYFTLLPFESKVIPDVYKTAFAKEGLGRLRFQSGNMADSEGIRVTARIYTQEADGGTYGFVMPALNAFQAAGPGESLEIMGAFIDEGFRTNLALVDTIGWTNAPPMKVTVEIFGTGGALLDKFDTNVRAAGGTHLLDIFTNRGLESETPTPVIIRVSPSIGIIGAFATMIDNGTNDSLYLGAGLAAQ